MIEYFYNCFMNWFLSIGILPMELRFKCLKYQCKGGRNPKGEICEKEEQSNNVTYNICQRVKGHIGEHAFHKGFPQHIENEIELALRETEQAIKNGEYR